MKTFKLKHLQDIDSGKIIERKLNEDFSEIPVKYITELKAGDYIRSCGVLNNSCMLKKNVWRRIDAVDYAKGLIKYAVEVPAGKKTKIIYKSFKFNRYNYYKFIE